MKQVRFDPTASTTSIPLHDTGGSSDAATATWLTDRDYSRICRGIKKTVLAVRREEAAGGRGSPLDEDEMTLRGIEHLQSAEVLRRQIGDKDRAIEAVFREQERQVGAAAAAAGKMGMATIDDGAIARAYLVHSRQARRAALLRAASDEAIARADDELTSASSSSTSAATPTMPASQKRQQYLDILQESLNIDMGTNPQGAGTTAAATGTATIDTTTGEGEAQSAPSRSAGGMHAPSMVDPLRQKPTQDQGPSSHSSLGSWLNHHDSRSLRLSGTR